MVLFLSLLLFLLLLHLRLFSLFLTVEPALVHVKRTDSGGFVRGSEMDEDKERKKGTEKAVRWVGMAGWRVGWPQLGAEGQRGQELLAPIPSKSQFSSLVEL